jgi:hypothetical protein
MDRRTTIVRSMRSVSSISCFEGVVVGVAIREDLARLHAPALRWRWTPSGGAADPQAACGFARA